MIYFNPQSNITPTVLATDLDGTLIPLPDSPENNESLNTLKCKLSDSNKTLVYATGRHFESALEAMTEYKLPRTDWIICDVGSAIYVNRGGVYLPFTPYEAHLSETVGGVDRKKVESQLQGIDGLELQPPDHQQRFKISYQSDANQVEPLVATVNVRLEEAKLPYYCMGSHDPFLNCGLLDVMPSGVSKAYALIWLSTHADFTPDEVIYSGDSGNDYAALTSGFRAIVVSNHSVGLADKVRTEAKSRGLEDRIFLAKNTATTGVLEGCEHYGLFDT
ncbi:MAG: HAD-IIB family hydrolase [Opitutales bacterium]